MWSECKGPLGQQIGSIWSKLRLLLTDDAPYVVETRVQAVSCGRIIAGRSKYSVVLSTMCIICLTKRHLSSIWRKDLYFRLLKRVYTKIWSIFLLLYISRSIHVITLSGYPPATRPVIYAHGNVRGAKPIRRIGRLIYMLYASAPQQWRRHVAVPKQQRMKHTGRYIDCRELLWCSNRQI